MIHTTEKNNNVMAHVGYPVKIMVIDCFDVDQKKLCDRKWWIPVSLHKITTKVIFSDEYVLRHQNYSIVIFNNENAFFILGNRPGNVVTDMNYQFSI